MSRTAITITCGGTTKTAAEWGIEVGARIRRNAARDTLTLVQTVARFDEADIFPHGEYVDVHRGDQRWFRGRVMPTASVKSAVHQKTFVLAGGWLELERRQYLQLWRDSALAAFLASSRVQLGFADTAPINNLAQASAAIAFAISKGAPLQIGTIDTGIMAPAETARALMVSEVVRKSLRWTPDCVCWFDYATDPVTVNIRRATNLTAVDVSAGAFDDDLSIEPSFEFQVNGVIVRVKHQIFGIGDIGGGAFGSAGAFNSYYTTDVYPPQADLAATEAVAGADGWLLFLLDAGTDIMSGTPSAEAIYNTFAGLGWRGSSTLKAADLPTALSLGSRLNVTGTARSEWAAMAATIQQIEEDIQRGVQRVTFGTPAHINSADLIDLMSIYRRALPAMAGDIGDQQTGQSDSRNRGDGGGGGGGGDESSGSCCDSLPTFEGTVCVDGVEKTATFYGTVAS